MSRRTRVVVVTATLAILCCAGSARANVSLKNGNFFIGYTDVVLPGTPELKIERVYNSKTPFKGIFGWGWGSSLEVGVETYPGGGLSVHEYGGGAVNTFGALPQDPQPAELLASAARVFLARARAQRAVVGADLMDLWTLLKKDTSEIDEEWAKERSQSALPLLGALPSGAAVFSTKFGFQVGERWGNGFVRLPENQSIQRFDSAGRLVEDIDGHSGYEVEYGTSSRRLTDTVGRTIVIHFGPNKLASSVTYGDKTATYEYDANDNMIYSRDVDGNEFRYAWSTDGRHNLVRIGYGDGTDMAISYYGMELAESVRSVKDRDGTLTRYRYPSLPKAAPDACQGPPINSHFAVEVAVTGTDGKSISNSTYEYYEAALGGLLATCRLVTTLDGDLTDTTYDIRSGVPLRIQHGGEVTSFKYDEKGRVLEKDTPTELTVLTYDQRAGKVRTVTGKSKLSGSVTNSSSFHYDEMGQLDYADTSSGRHIDLKYDTQGRIHWIISSKPNNRIIEFTYNAIAKPVKIHVLGVGSITVDYAPSGEILKVDSDKGRKVALEVTSAFQELLDIIRPAGVSLSF